MRVKTSSSRSRRARAAAFPGPGAPQQLVQCLVHGVTRPPAGDLAERAGIADQALEILERDQEVTREAAQRISQIVQSLKGFVRLDASAVESADLNQGLQHTLTLLEHEFQGRVTVVTVHRLSDGGLRLRNNGLNEAYHGTSDPRYAEAILGYPHPLIDHGISRLMEAKAADPAQALRTALSKTAARVLFIAETAGRREALLEIGRMVVDDLEAIVAGRAPTRMQYATPDLIDRMGS